MSHKKKRHKRRHPEPDHDRRVIGYTGGWVSGQFSGMYGSYYGSSGYVTGTSGSGTTGSVDAPSSGDFGAGAGDGGGVGM